MSFFFGSSAVPASDLRPLSVTPERTSQSAHGRPVPYVFGQVRVGVTFLSEPWGIRSSEVKADIGKEDVVVGYNYWCSFAAALCLGPIDTVHEIRMDNSVVWTGPVSRAGDDYLDITIEGRGTVRLYWGTETQTQDPDLLASGVLHPAYRGTCYAVFLDLFVGRDHASAPNIEFTISRYPVPAWLTAAKAIEEDANPLAVFGDIWGHPRFGLGLSSDRLDTILLNLAATALVNEGIGLSGVITSGTGFNAFLADLLRHCDACLVSGVDGKFGLRLVRGPAGDEPTLDESSLTEEPSIEVDTWAETFNQTVVKFINRDKDMIEDSVTWNDRANFTIVGATKSQTLEMPWVTRQQLAWKIAAAHCKQSALPRLRGSLVARASAAQGLAPGSLFYLSFAASGLANVLCRVESRTIPSPSSPAVSLQFIEDRGYLNTPDYVVPQDDALEVQRYEPATTDTVKVIELPWAFREDNNANVSVVVVRGDTLSNRYKLWWERVTDSYKLLATQARFGLRAALNVPLTPTGPLVGTIDFTLVSPDKTLPEIAEDEALLGHSLLFAGDEILWAWDFTLVGPSRYTAQLLRARYGTLRVGHDVGDGVILFFPTDDRRLTVHRMPLKVATQRFKAQPLLFQVSRDLADCLPVSHAVQLRAYRPLAPLNLRVQGDGHCPTYSTGQNIALTWDQSSPRRAVNEAEDDCLPHADRVVAEVWDAAGEAKKGEWTFDEAGSGTIPNAGLVAALGAESSFILKAYNQRGSFRSLTSAQLTVTKV